MKPVSALSERKQKHLEVLASALGLTIKKLEQMGVEDNRKREATRIKRDRDLVAHREYYNSLPVKKREKQWRLVSY